MSEEAPSTLATAWEGTVDLTKKAIDGTVDLGKATVDATVDLSKATVERTSKVIADPGQAAIDAGAAIKAGSDIVVEKTVEGSKATIDATVDLSRATVELTKDAIADPGQAANNAIEQTKRASEATMAMASEVSSLMMGGIETTFATLGASAGFQAVMKGFAEELDTSDAALEKLFADIDYDGSGQISDREMGQAISKMYGQDLDDELLAKMMKAADTDGNGEIDLDEFKVIMRSRHGSAMPTDEKYTAAVEVLKKKFPKCTFTDGRYIPTWEGGAPPPKMYSTPFPKLPKVKMWATKRPQKDMASMAQELMDQFNKDKYMINGQMDYSLYSPYAIYKDPSYPPNGIPVEAFPDASGMIDVNDGRSDLVTVGEPAIEGNVITITFFVMMCMTGVLPWPFFVLGTGTLAFTIQDGLIVQVYEEYIDFKTKKPVSLLTLSTLFRWSKPDFQERLLKYTS